MTPDSMIQLLVGKPTYIPGEKIQIMGAFNPDDLIHIDLVNPFDGTKNSTLLQSDATGHFRTNYIVPYNAVNGTWKILATSGFNHASLDIQVISSNYGLKNKNATYGSDGSVTITPIKSPLKQFKSGIPAKNTTCQVWLQLIFKSENGSPACVKPNTAQKLVERGWAMVVTTYTQQNIPTLSNSITVPNTNFIINYDFAGNGKILGANMDTQSKSLILSLETTSNGTLTVSIPRALLDIKKNERGMGEFYILADGRETIFKEIHTTQTDRIFSIPFQNGTSKIMIIATELI